jgi:PAS domain S-box-containing protein
MSGARILVVDDNALNRKILATIASNQGHLVEQAAGGKEALERLRQGNIDIVLLDLVMPEVDGFAVLNTMKQDEALRHIPVVVISAQEGMDNIIRSLEMGAADYLQKPVDAILLKARLNAILIEKRLRDVERRHIVQLRSVQARLSAIIDSSPMGIVLIDMEGRIAEANPTFHRLLRREGEDLRGRNLASFCSGGSLHGEEMTRFLQGPLDGTFSHEGVMARGDGSRFNVRLTMSLVPAEGRADFAVAMLEDVTERALAEEALKQNEESLRKVFESAPFPLVITEVSGMIIETNRKAAEMFEVDPRTVRGTDVMEFYQNAEDRDRILTLLRENGHVENHEVGLRTASGKHHWLMVSVRQATLGGVACFLVAAYDITERREMEHALHEANRKLGLLNSITRHDILNQTLVLNGYIELARRDKGGNISKFLDRMSIASENIRKQITFTRDYQDMGVKAAEWFELGKVMSSCFNQISPQGVELHLETNGYAVLADPLVEKVFYNLIDNSMRHGSGIHNITLSGHEADGKLLVVYADDGCGINPDDRQYLFEKGFGKNTGLGLFLSKEILSITGISICENGEQGKGVRFEMLVPKGRFRQVNDK